ncbi:uncharacterized protein LOC116298044 [Actinia tenebrosa]|uniref:Uncharacterized protein LOC116298044 n=1 Tax=Actinia tenebrosa TaxID=6105 RepID=A0A6P8I0X0_ACTTE|nr:uncharacterized protein LOC116298044 [Actinia tenebrosa]
MDHTDDCSPLNAESPLKRKAISECRLQDPKIWTKISWIRTHFVKDLESGVRKTDFYDYVTEHLGKTGYRDVWHLLKIAYPHVDRVRRGRKYMYWGVRHADDHVKFEETDDGNNGEDDDEETNVENHLDQDKEFSAEESSFRMEVESFSEESRGNQLDELNYSQTPPESKTPSTEHTKLPSGLLVKVEKDTDNDDQKQSDVVVIEFKDKEVFASFEDYEKSKQTSDQNGNLIKIRGEKTRGRKTANEGDQRTVVRSVSPPLEIFSLESLKDDDKNNNHLSNPKDHHNNDEFKSDRMDNRQATSLKQHDGCHGDSDNGTAVLKEPENGSLSKSQEGKLPIFGDKRREEMAPNLLHPENINRMCMPLIKDLGNKNTKTRPTNENDVNDSVANDQLNDIQDENAAGLSANDTDSNSNNEVGINGKFPYHPLIVSVTSIAGVGIDSKGSDRVSSDEINNILKASTQLQSCKSVTARFDVNDGSTRQTSSSQSLPDGEAEFVVVQDRGIQVTEQVHTCNQLGKRSSKHIKSTICHKPSHSPHHEHTSKKLPSSNSTNVRSLNPGCPKNSSPIVVNIEQGVQNVSSLQGRARAWHSGPPSPSSVLFNRTSPRQPDSNTVHGQPRLFTTSPRDSRSVTKAMGNVVRSEEPLMKGLMKIPPKYHTLVVNNNYPGLLQTEEKRLLPKTVISPEVQNTVNKHQDRLSPKYSSSQSVVYGTSTIEHRPSLTLLRSQQEKQLFDQNLNKTRTTGQLSSNEQNNGECSADEGSLRTRDFLRNLLSHHESKSNNPTTNTSSTSDLQVTVECLSSELEKERTMRLRLEIELRKVENQLNEERKLNERLASMLMKR